MLKSFLIDSKYAPGIRPDILSSQLRSYDDLINVASPDISVISCSKNLGRFLEDTIRSVANQTFRNFEHIVIDGASTDNSVEILKKYPHVRWVSEPDSGAIEAIWKGFKMARGRYIMVCYVSDGYANANWFEYCANYLNTHPNISLVSGWAQNLSENGLTCSLGMTDEKFNLLMENADSFYHGLKVGPVFYEGNLCVRREVFQKCYPANEQETEDMVDWLLFNYRILTFGYLGHFYPEVAAFSRRHEGSLGQKWSKSKRLRRRHRNFFKLLWAYRLKILLGFSNPVFINSSGRIKNLNFSRLKFLKGYLIYILSWGYIRDILMNNFARVKRRIAALVS